MTKTGNRVDRLLSVETKREAEGKKVRITHSCSVVVRASLFLRLRRAAETESTSGNRLIYGVSMVDTRDYLKATVAVWKSESVENSKDVAQHMGLR